MSAWTDGYVAEITYIPGFYREQTPSLMRLALTLRGFECPSLSDFRYCELGYGHGLSANLLAAANAGGEFWGTDFNPQHAAGAQQLARRAGLAHAHWFDESFREFLDRDTPPFDFIVLHGIYSWVSEENQKTIVEILRRKLKVGGVVYISYNTLPGWSSAMPLRYLLKSHAESMSAAGSGLVDKLKQSIDFVERMMELKTGYFAATPGLANRVKQLREHSPNYVVHEYLNTHWSLAFFGEMVEALAPAKLTYAASATLTEHVDTLCLPAEATQRLAQIGDPVFRETVRDFLRNQQFRRDLFVRGARTLTAEEQRNRLLDTRFTLAVPRAQVTDKLKVPVGEVNLKPEVYRPLADILAEGVYSLGQLLDQPELAPAGFRGLAEALTVLAGAGQVCPCLSEAEQAASTAPAQALNRAILEHTAAGRQDFAYLAAPCLGSGVGVGRFEQLFLRELAQGGRKPEDWAQAAWKHLQSLGQSLVRDGQALAAEENLAELRLSAEKFAAEHLPVLRRLGVVD
jgi:predicted O-methyltransferase YrrM